jgi:uncharacterized repeat protein (TIGR04076 family)
MADYKIKCIVVDIKTSTGVCPGSAKCRKDEEYIITARTPDVVMCGRAFAAIHPMAFGMRWSDKLQFERNNYVDVACPDGFVTYRLTRIIE